MGACSISSLKIFLYLQGSSVCDDPGKYKKNLIINCVISRLMSFFIFISIKKFHKA